MRMNEEKMALLKEAQNDIAFLRGDIEDIQLRLNDAIELLNQIMGKKPQGDKKNNGL